ncbi:glycosyltransferase family 2 protein [Devosia psychrophila]|uniref:Dolichol monophosphate mannose synthase n=1 Tax=Devosia psychrophila TaxID=728005 RepID=A0A0F5Q0T6_9HYPH|nr:glycosyltransferase family 2 protein [Devosia psychrophila]KKC33674.1 dolichol monophosphate mannose synthase [Devosia psychrophila]SFC71401.1 dolichol-phosphate mannosyltransferase [Devosia psychrophila]
MSTGPVTTLAAEQHSNFRPPQLAVIVPSYNERDNIELLYEKVALALGGTPWEMIVVDDDSPDGTADLVNELSRVYANIRCLRRFGRRGLASACVEGMAVTSAPYVAVIDGDLQHDEAILPTMLEKALAGADLVVGSRFTDGGSAGEGLSQTRLSGSNFANKLAGMIAGQAVSDPMSGFFLIRRDAALKAAPKLASDGFKILIDLIVTSARMGQPLKVAEVGYTFRPRHAGESKMSPLVVIQYLGLWFSKLTNGALPPSFLLFGLVGGTGVVVHLVTLAALTALGQGFLVSQITATLLAMGWNFVLNNNLTYADRKLRGRRLVTGFISFCAICALGGIANISVANAIYQWDHQTFVAGLSGAIMSSVFNYAVTRAFTWK